MSRPTAISLRRALSLVFVAALAFTLMGAGEVAQGVDQHRFNDLGHRLMCKCGCNQVLLECNHVGCTVSERMRGELIAAMQSGGSDQQILAMFVDKYGPTVLAAPTTSGFNLVAWIVAFAVLPLGLLGVILFVRRWKLRPAPAAVVPLPRLPADQLEALRVRARQETEL